MTFKSKLKELGSRWGVGVAFLAAVAIYIALDVVQPTVKIPHAEIAQHLMLVLAAVMGVHLLEHTWLRRSMDAQSRETLKDVLEKSNVIIESAAASGLQKIYSSRDERVKKDVIQDIVDAKDRVWLLGVGLSEKISLNPNLIRLLGAKTKTADVRILLLDALRSPAVFRTFLESSAEEFHDIIRTDRSDPNRPPPSDPYFRRPLYRAFENAHATLSGRPDFRAVVRFYAHTPNCWLAITDNTAYFQPYTFGRGEEDDATIGPQMPVFKFESVSKMKPFRILEDHFEKLWLTSTADLFHVGARIADRNLLLHQIFKKRQPWFDHIYGALHAADKKRPAMERRVHPRQVCESHPRSVTLSWKSGGGDAKQQIDAKIINFSCNSVLVELKQQTYPQDGAEATLEVVPDEQERASVYFCRELMKSTGGRYKIARILKQTPPRVALRANG